MSVEQADILKRISAARGNSEPEQSAPTEENQVAEVEPEATEEVTTEEDNTEAVEEVEAVENDDQSLPEQTPEESEELYVDIDGREISLTEIKEWEQGNLRQSDYTKKTTDLADSRKVMTGKEEALDNSIAQLQVLLDESNKEIDWDDLEEYDPGEFIKQNRLRDKRKEALAKAKGAKPASESKVDVQVELDKLLVSNPQWIKDGKETKQYGEDMKTVDSYLSSLGYTDDTKRGILTGGHGQVFIDAARFHAGNKANSKTFKKLKKAPIVTKPGSTAKSVSSIALDKAKKAHAKIGSISTAAALRKIQRG